MYLPVFYLLYAKLGIILITQSIFLKNLPLKYHFAKLQPDTHIEQHLIYNVIII